MGAPVTPAATKNTAHLRWEWARYFDDVPAGIGASLCAYLECALGTRTRNTVSHMAGRLAHFARTVTEAGPELSSLAGLDRQRHVEPYLAAVAAARNPRTGAVLSASERRSRVLTVGRMIDDIIEWGWHEAPAQRLIFSRDVPRLPRALPRYLPADADRALAAALRASPHRLPADALLLLPATGMRIGELLDLELDCAHEVPGAGAWLKVPLGMMTLVESAQFCSLKVPTWEDSPWRWFRCGWAPRDASGVRGPLRSGEPTRRCSHRGKMWKHMRCVREAGRSRRSPGIWAGTGGRSGPI
jgi:hypothetical protein